MFCTLNWKFPGRRKAEKFYIYKEQNNEVIIQSDRSIAQINMETHKGMLNTKGQDDKYFMHLNSILGAIPYTFPDELIDLIERKRPRKGDFIGSSEITGPIIWG